MDGQVAGLLVILVGITLLFAFEWVSADVVAIGLLVTLVLTGMITMEEAFAGFGSPTFMLLFGLFVLTAALTRTGVVDMTGRRMLRYTGEKPEHVLLTVMLTAAGMSAVISNTAASRSLKKPRKYASFPLRSVAVVIMADATEYVAATH